MWWFLNYIVLGAGVTPGETFGSVGSTVDCMSSPCQVEIKAGETYVDVNLFFFGPAPSGTVGTLTVMLPSGHPSGVELGSSNSVTVTVQ